MAKPDRLIYLPLGGAGEIGMNMYLYGYGPEGAERFILVDMGVSFPTMESTPGVELIMADPAWIQARADRLEAIFITHGHEDHLGALGLLWHRLQAPVYARRFTAALAKAKMERAGQPTDEVRQVDAWPHVVAGRAVHASASCRSRTRSRRARRWSSTRRRGGSCTSADFKADPTPLVGEPFDPAALRRSASRACKVLACDSTNVFNAHAGRSEATLIEPIGALMQRGRGPGRRHDLRLERRAAEDAGRRRGGRPGGSRRARAGDEHDAEDRACGGGARRLSRRPSTRSTPTRVPRRQPAGARHRQPGRAARGLGAAGAGQYMGLRAQGRRHLPLLVEDHSRQRGGGRAHPQPLSEKGVRVIDDSDGHYHVSGHANRPDLVTLQTLLRPQMIVPMHGEHRHLSAHAALARERGIARRWRRTGRCST